MKSVEVECKKEFVKILLESNVLVGKDVLQAINSIPDFISFYRKFNERRNNGAVIISNGNVLDILAYVPSQARVAQSSEAQNTGDSVEIIDSYQGIPKKRSLQDFVSLFNYRYRALQKMLVKRKELDGAVSISRAAHKQDRDEAAIIGMILDKHVTKNGNVILTLEDPTGTMKVLINKNKPELLEMAKDCVFDEVVGATGNVNGNFMFVNNLLVPDIPLTKELKKSPDEVYAAFLGDMHFGHKEFIKESWEKMLKWIKGETGNEEQREIAKKIKYIFIVGDLVEGVGIYPSQEKDLEIKDIYEQYNRFAEYMKEIPGHMQIIICPGNHDAMRIAEPQPPLYKDFAGAIYELPNVTMVSNPSIVNVHKTENFPGFDVMLYHGFSFIYYADNVESIRAAGGANRIDLVTKFLLQRRHLAPTHTSTLYLPDADKDNHLIERVPDIFISGHVHCAGVSNYRNVQVVECGCWIKTTEFQEKVGLMPQPGRVPVINLKTRQGRMMRFYNEDG